MCSDRVHWSGESVAQLHWRGNWCASQGAVVVVFSHVSFQTNLMRILMVWTAHLTRHIFSCFHSTHFNVTLTLAQEQGVWRARHTCVIFMRSRCGLLGSLRLSLLLFAFHLLSHLPYHSLALHLLLPSGGQEPCALLQMRTLASWPRTILSKVMSPTTSTSQRLLKNSSRSPSATAGPRTCMTGKSVTTPPTERSLQQEREDPASRGQAYHSLKESLLSSQSSSAGHVRTGRLVSDRFDSLISNVRENPCRDSENEQSRNLLKRQKEHIFSQVVEQRFQKHEFQSDYDRRNIQQLNGVIESQRGEIFRALAGDERLRRDQHLLHVQLLEQNRDLLEVHEKSPNEMEEMKQFQGSTFHTISRRKLIEDRDTILDLTGKI